MLNEQQRWFKRETILLNEIKRLQEVEIESDLKLCALTDEVNWLRKENERLKKETLCAGRKEKRKWWLR